MNDLQRLNEVLKIAFSKIGVYKKGDMATYLGYKSPYFSGVINGKEKLTVQFLKLISDKLQVNSDWILTGEGSMLQEHEEKAAAAEDGKGEVSRLLGVIESQQRVIEGLVEELKRRG